MRYLFAAIFVRYLVPTVVFTRRVSLLFGERHLLDKASCLLDCIDDCIDDLGFAGARNGFKVLAQVKSDQDPEASVRNIFRPVLATTANLKL